MLRTKNTLSLTDNPRSLDKKNTDFSFLPSTLVSKSKQFIETYHELNGYSSLVVILWHPEIRNYVEINECLKLTFKKATTSRSAKKADQGLVLVATAILSLEIMSSGFAGWAQRFPSAHRKANGLLRTYVPSARTWLMDNYLYPRAYVTPGVLLALSPPEFPIPESDIQQPITSRIVASVVPERDRRDIGASMGVLV